MRDGAGIMSLEGAQDAEGGGDDVDESIDSAEVKVRRAGTEAGEIALGCECQE